MRLRTWARRRPRPCSHWRASGGAAAGYDWRATPRAAPTGRDPGTGRGIASLRCRAPVIDTNYY
jgi:hypothetical protein